MEEIKIIGLIMGIAVVVISAITGIIVVTTYFSNQNDDQKFVRTIQCKEVGGRMTYENYSWICK